MNRRYFALFFLGLCAPGASADPVVESTEYLGPFIGGEASLHPANQEPRKIAWYGTDLGFSYLHGDRLVFLFGDSWATEAYAPIEESTGSKFDDAWAWIERSEWPEPASVQPGKLPLLRIAQNPGTTEAAAMNPGHASDLGKTPMAGWSNGTDEYGIFNITKPIGCAADSDCVDGLGCDLGLGYLGSPFDTEEQLTLPCIDGSPFCNAQTLASAPEGGSGLCVDTGSTVWADSEAGRTAAVALAQRVGRRSSDDPRVYGDIRHWPTNRFVNMTATTVQGFDPAALADADYRPATAEGSGRRVFIWGRPGFISVNANGRTLGLYFAVADLPEGGDYTWKPRFYAGTEDGKPVFSDHEKDAVPLDLDATTPGVQPKEVHDIVQQMSVEWIEPLGKWVMFYGGGIIDLPSPVLPRCGVLELFTRSECDQVVYGNGAVRMRTADQPWGPWSPPQDVIVGGDPDVAGSGQYGPGGSLNHPDCTADDCSPHTQTPFYNEKEYGFLYSANIINEWTTTADGEVVLLWNASTWDPYRVALFRTRIQP